MVLCLKAWKSRSLPGFDFIMYFSIIIPVYNEELNIEKLLDEISKSLKKNDYDYEIVVIDDASTDSTLSIIKNLNKNKVLNLSIIENKSNIGQSLSLVKGIKFSKHKTIITIEISFIKLIILAMTYSSLP